MSKRRGGGMKERQKDSEMKNKRVAIMLYRLKFGGAERVMLTLAEAFAERGLTVDLVACEAKGEFLGFVPDGINVINLDTPGTFKASKRLAQYIDRDKPDSIIANGDRCTMAAYLARKKNGHIPRVISVVHHDLLGALLSQEGSTVKNKFIAWMKKIPMSYIYPRIDKIVAVSKGSADSVTKFLGYPREQIEVIYNPIKVDEIRKLAQEPVEHLWFTKKDQPIVISVGRLTPQKDFPTLIHAFALLLKETQARLMIIGEGPERERLGKLISELGIEKSVDLLGFQNNPHKFVARADLFAMSSIFEGLPTVLLEAMTLRVPIVSTDCPSGPAELLTAHPERLVPMRNPEMLEAGILSLLGAKKEEICMDDFSIDAACKSYYCIL